MANKWQSQNSVLTARIIACFWKIGVYIIAEVEQVTSKNKELSVNDRYLIIITCSSNFRIFGYKL